MKKLSIITICYNEPNLEETCKSIINQSWQEFEWIVIDGGSNKETLDIFNKYKHRIDKFISEPDNGRYNAMNKGINLADGEYINFLNAGDYYFYDNVLKDIFVNNTYKSDVLYGNECFVNENDILKSQIQPMPKKLTKDFLFYSSLRHQAAFIKKILFDKFGLYDENKKVVSDYEKWFIFLKNGVSFECLPYTITYFNTDGISSNKKTRKIARKERNDVINAHFKTSEIDDLINKNKHQDSFLERIFSVKNNVTCSHKIITILGCKIKIKRNYC